MVSKDTMYLVSRAQVRAFEDTGIQCIEICRFIFFICYIFIQVAF